MDSFLETIDTIKPRMYFQMYQMAKLLRSSNLISYHQFDPTSGHLKVKVENVPKLLTFRKKVELVNFAHGYPELQDQLRSFANHIYSFQCYKILLGHKRG